MQSADSPATRSPEKDRRGVSAIVGTLVVFGVLILLIAPFVDLDALRRTLFTTPPQPEHASGVNLEVYEIAGARPPAVTDGLTSTSAPAPRVLHEVIGQREAELTTAPLVPPAPEQTPHNTKVIVHLEVLESVMRLADGVEYTFWTFGGSVPGKFIRVREGDVVEFHLANHPNNKLPHNIDLHAVTGPGGGAEASMVAPGQQVTFTFRALNAGLYVYHCATAPVPMHIANGMYGLIFVDPFAGLPPVDHEFYFMQSEFYTTGANGEKGLQPFSQEKAVREQPEYVVFNGAVGATVGAKAPVVQRGERVRLFVGNGGPNLVSSFHVIGEIFDRVYVEGGTRLNENVQTTLVPAGGSAVVEFTCEAPSMLNLVDHSIFRVFNKGALAQIRVAGDLNAAVYTSKQDVRDYDPAAAAFVLPADAATIVAEVTPPAAPVEPQNLAERMQHGRDVYQRTCFACHGVAGAGMPNVFPPLANSDFLRARPDKGVGIVLAGLQGPVKVNGQTFNSVMPPQVLSDQEVASVLTYVHNTWGNDGGEVTPAEVAAGRAKLGH
jgi:nitrite reductase (NO-forming)